MTNYVGRRAVAGAAALLPAAALVSSAHAQTGSETTFDRIRRTKLLRVAGLPGALPYFDKDIVSGKYSGACADMASDIAKVFGAQVTYLDSTYGNSVLDLQSNKIDLAFALNPTPQRALSIGFAHAVIIHPFGCLAKHGLNPTKWDDLNKPDIRICFDIGSLHETAARRYCPKAQLTGYQTTDQCLLALQSGHQDVEILAALLGLAAVGKNPSLGPYHLLTDPTVALPSCLGIQWEPDSRFAVVLNAWIDFNRGTGQIREWLLNGLSKFGVKREQVPPELSF